MTGFFGFSRFSTETPSTSAFNSTGHRMESGVDRRGNGNVPSRPRQLGEIEKKCRRARRIGKGRCGNETERAMRTCTVLLVEDDADPTRNCSPEVLAMQGCKVSTANDGDQALDYSRIISGPITSFWIDACPNAWRPPPVRSFTKRSTRRRICDPRHQRNSTKISRIGFVP